MISLTKEAVFQYFTDFEKLKILVIGDLMLDRYLWGKVVRISPEAPVPVVDVQNEENRLGGAANVALNLQALGVTPILCGVIGQDENANYFNEVLKQTKISNEAILQSSERKTTSKIRIIGNNQQILRVDKEDRFNLTENEKAQLIHKILPLIPHIQGIIFEDYDKGLLDENLIQEITQIANSHHVPIFVDPKFKNFNHYKNCTVFKPNLKELNEGLGERLDFNEFEKLLNGIEKLKNNLNCQNILLTLSEHGVIAFKEKADYQHIPAHIRQIKDVSGAGDTVISVLASCYCSGMNLNDSSICANLAGGLVCEEVGVVTIKKPKLLIEILNLIQNN